MRGDPLALQIKGHTKTQRAPSKIFRLIFPFLKIFLSLLYSIKRTILESSAEPSLNSLPLGVRKGFVSVFLSLDLRPETHGWRPDWQD